MQVISMVWLVNVYQQLQNLAKATVFSYGPSGYTQQRVNYFDNNPSGGSGAVVVAPSDQLRARYPGYFDSSR